MKKVAKELREKSKADLQKEIQSLYKSIAIDRVVQAATMPKDTNALSKKKRRLAIALTILNGQL